MHSAKLSFCISSTGTDLHVSVTLDDQVIYDDRPGLTPSTVTYEFDDTDDREHMLIFQMQNKLPEHTTISDTGEILKDTVIQISNLSFDDIELGHMFTEHARYHHDTNGTTDPIIDTFYGEMGCNGRVEMRFSTPIYLWLLENM